jgi:hypothetical protein
VRDDYPLQATFAMMNLIDSHDTNRALYVLTEQGDSGLTQAKQRLELAALFRFTYIGAPTVFYGDEAAINAPSRYNSSSGRVGDPYTRAPYPWTDQAGDPSIYGPPDQNVIAFYTKLGHIRKQYPALSSGTFVTLLTGDTQQANTAPNTYAYARVGTNQTAVGARAIDNAGNISSLISASVNIDLTPPVVTVIGVTNNASYAYNSVPTSKQPIAGPLQLVLTNLPPRATVVNATGTWGGNPYLTIVGSTLAPGASAEVAVQFSHRPGHPVNPTPLVYSATLRN